MSGERSVTERTGRPQQMHALCCMSQMYYRVTNYVCPDYPGICDTLSYM